LILYRVSNHADLTGKGGELADGKWHTRQLGRRIVYLSDHPALCLLEILVHISERDWLPDWYQLLSVDGTRPANPTFSLLEECGQLLS
jgi:RES domain-containing protein